MSGGKEKGERWRSKEAADSRLEQDGRNSERGWRYRSRK